MADTKTVIEQAYSAFNRRDIDGALALMTEDVSWPKASEGARLSEKKRSAPIGLDNGASSMAMSNRWKSPRKTEARFASRCINASKTFKEVLWDGEVLHVFTVNSGLIAAMDLGYEDDATAGPTAAFAHRS